MPHMAASDSEKRRKRDHRAGCNGGRANDGPKRTPVLLFMRAAQQSPCPGDVCHLRGSLGILALDMICGP